MGINITLYAKFEDTKDHTYCFKHAIQATIQNDENITMTIEEEMPFGCHICEGIEEF